jgi:hypothetical protein
MTERWWIARAIITTGRLSAGTRTWTNGNRIPDAAGNTAVPAELRGGFERFIGPLAY